MKTILSSHGRSFVGALAASLLVAGCSKSGDDGPVTAKSPEQTASALDTSFADAAPAVKQNVSAVSEALRKREYEKAVISLEAVKQSQGVATLQQGMAVQSSVILLERELINAMERGDERARQAYQILKRMNRN